MRSWLRYGLALAVLAALLAYPAYHVAKRFRANQRCCAVPVAHNVPLSVLEFLGRRTFYSQFGQDRWVLETVFPYENRGFFVDVGSADGTDLSNTKALEARGWTGLCIDPFPTNMGDRTCRMLKSVVYHTAGEVVKFRAAEVMGGIDSQLNAHRNLPNVQQSPTVELTTTTLADLLDAEKAPSFIHYISLDIEGAELDALRAFPFDRYKVGAFTIEHNNEEPKRSAIEALLRQHGYERVHSYQVDDYYLPVKR